MNNIREIDDWTPASGDLVPTLMILDGLACRLKSYELTPGTPLFGTVAVFDTPNLSAAFEELRTFADRVCLLIPSGDKYTALDDGSQLRVTCEREFELLVCDRDAGQRQYALVGEPDPTGATPDAQLTPGVIRIKDYVVKKLLGDHLELLPRTVKLRPSSGQSFRIQGNDRGSEWGRVGWQMTWQAYAGHVTRRTR